MEAYVYNAVVVRVIDGDTFCVNCDLGFRLGMQMTLRMLGINAPEMHAKDQDERERAIAARDALSAMLPFGSNVLIRTVKSDSFGRYLAVVYKDGVSINAQMISTGHAVAFMT